MKKFFVVASILAALALVSCEQPLSSNTSTTSTVNNTISKIQIPDGLKTVVGTAGQVTLAWNPVAGATSFEVYKSVDNGPFTKVTNLISVDQTKVIIPVSGQNEFNKTQSFKFAVRAILTGTGSGATGSGGPLVLNSSDLSASVSADFSAATIAAKGASLAKVTNVAVTDDAVLGVRKITWDAVENATSYQVYGLSLADESTYDFISTSGGLSKAVDGTALIINDTYQAGSIDYYVKAVPGDTYYAPSVSAVVNKTVASALAKPTISVSSTGAGSLTVAITPVANATSYDVYRNTQNVVATNNATSTNNNGAWTKLTTLTSFTRNGTTASSILYNDTTVTAGVTYGYSVVAKTSTLVSYPSSVSTGSYTALSYTLSSPGTPFQSGVDVTASSGGTVQFSFTAVVNPPPSANITYTVYRRLLDLNTTNNSQQQYATVAATLTAPTSPSTTWTAKDTTATASTSGTTNQYWYYVVATDSANGVVSQSGVGIFTK